MHTQRMAHSAMIFSVVSFTAIGVLDFYPLIRFYQWDNYFVELLQGFLLKFDPLKQPYYNKFFLLFVVIGSVMLYYPKKVEGKTFATGLVTFTGGFLFLLLSDLIKQPLIHLYQFAALLDILVILTPVLVMLTPL